jgi:hypothetical protein
MKTTQLPAEIRECRPRLRRAHFAIPCTIRIVNSDESLEAHVELDEGILPTSGDRIVVHGERIVAPIGESVTFRRAATLTRASILDKFWVRIRSMFELTELYEVSFSPARKL